MVAQRLIMYYYFGTVVRTGNFEHGGENTTDIKGGEHLRGIHLLVHPRS